MSLPNEHSARIKSPIPKNAAVTSRKQIAPGVSIILQKNKGDTDKPLLIQSYRFKKNRFKDEEARAWLKNHKVGFQSFVPAEDATETREEIVDRIQKELGEESLAASIKYSCQCLTCGKVIESEKHCIETSCPQCGGEMRRNNRPGIGR